MWHQGPLNDTVWFCFFEVLEMGPRAVSMSAEYIMTEPHAQPLKYTLSEAKEPFLTAPQVWLV